jgi:glycosyltransferase involved in cell wall biosynthesis
MQGKKRILLISKWYPSPQYSSAGIFVKRHALAASPHADISVLYAEASSDTRRIRRQYQAEQGLDTLCYTFPKTITGIALLDKILKSGLYYYCMWRGFLFLNKQKGPFDLTHATVLMRTGIFALSLYWIRRLPYIITEHWTGYLPLTGNYQRSLIRKLFSPLLIRKARLISPASDDLGRAMKAHGLNNNYVTVYNVVDTRLFHPLRQTKTGRIKILSVAMLLDKHKNISGMLRTLRTLKDEGFDFKYDILGKGEDEGTLKAYALELGLSSTVCNPPKKWRGGCGNPTFY